MLTWLLIFGAFAVLMIFVSVIAVVYFTSKGGSAGGENSRKYETPKTLSAIAVPGTRYDTSSSKNPADEFLRMRNASRDIMIWPRARLAGGVHQLQLRGKDIIAPLVGNGGSLQSMMFSHINHTEDWNPTQAGCSPDMDGKTTSQWQALAVDDPSTPKRMYARTRMAFWGDVSAPVGTKGSDGKTVTILHKNQLSEITLETDIQLDAPGLPKNAILYNVSYDIPGRISDHSKTNTLTAATFEILTGYTVSSIQKAWMYQNGRAVPVNGKIESSTKPCIVGDAKGLTCIGVIARKWHPGLNKPFFTWFGQVDNVPVYDAAGNRSGPQQIGKWNIVTVNKGQKLDGKYNVEVILVLGTLVEVTASIKRIV